MWIVWSGGNDRFWDEHDRRTTFGAFDLLKIVAYDPNKPIDRAERWTYLGLINEPCFDAPTAPDPKRFGLLLDTRQAGLPGRSVRERDQVSRREDRRARQGAEALPVGSLYGYASGIVGLRLFPNPDFDDAAKAKWDPERVLHRSELLQRPEAASALPRRHVLRLLPCRAEPGASAGRCRPIRNWPISAPRVGAQYMWVDRLFIYRRQSGQLHLPAGAHLPAGRDGHLAGLDRQHQQSADDERGLQPRATASSRRCAGAARRWPAAAQQQAVQRLSSAADR